MKITDELCRRRNGNTAGLANEIAPAIQQEIILRGEQQLPMKPNTLHDIIIKNIPLGFLLVNKEGVIIDFNEVAESISGYSRSEALGVPHCELFQCDTESSTCPLLQPPWKEFQKITETETVIEKKNGDHILIAATAFPLLDADGNFLGGAELFRDITRRARMEKERKNILAMFAHDIKNPAVASALMLSRVLSEKTGKLSECNKEWLHCVQENIERILNFADNFLAFSQFEAKKYVPEKMECDIGAALRRKIHVMKTEAEKKGITIQLAHQPETGTTLSADVVMLDRVITNLINNAVKYSDQGGVVDIRVQTRKDHVEVSVSDTGIGIAKDKLPHIFDPFYRVDHDTKGSGLGLAIAKSIIEAHGGRIYAESCLGKGSTFIFILPCNSNF